VSSADETSGGRSVADGQDRPSLVTLAPHFDPANHGVYRDLIIEAVDNEPTVRNLALTGAYGVGKSSILRDVSAHYGRRVVELSLASLVAASEETTPEASENPAAATPTNRIQREIVKQLLYRLPPSRMPQSRFLRAMKAEPALVWSVRWGVAIFLLLMGSGLAGLAVEGIADTAWRQVVAYACLLVATVAVTWLVRTNSGRVTVDSVSAGPAKVTLSRSSTSYFDEYLDEVVYFFEVSGCDVVVFEDIDRFGDPHIFETLRALNTLLNGSEQLRFPTAQPTNLTEHLRALVGRFKPPPAERKIVFIYAIHDGVFDLINNAEMNKTDKPVSYRAGDPERTITRVGDDDLEQRDIRLALESATTERDRVRDEVTRANRTKFFDLVIPVVPFITANNARDVLKRTMGDTSRVIKPELIKLVARHIADMRLVLNIRNEFEVYRNQLYDVPRRMHGLTEDLLFALVVYKNTHLGDFEAVRLQSSRLDTLYRLWRRMVNSEIVAATTRERAARALLDDHRASANRARELGAILVKAQQALAAGGQVGAQFAGIFLEAKQVSDDEVCTQEFWRAIANGSSVSFGSPTSRYNLTFSAEALAAFLNLPYSPDQWVELDTSTHEAAIEKARSDVWFLRHHTWKELYARDELAVLVGGDGDGQVGETLTFRALTERVLESRLARDLIREGYIDENFSLYVSTFYGEHVRPAATEYIMRCVRTGEPDAAFLLGAEDVDAIIAEEGRTVLRDPSMFNVSILDHLLANRPDDAATVVQELLKWGEAEHLFLDAYIEQGAHPKSLVKLAAAHWHRVFTYLVVESPAVSEQRVALFDAALSACSANLTYVLGDDVENFINENYAAFPALMEPTDASHAKAAFAVVEAAGSRLESAEGLSDLAKREVIDRRLYPLTADNLATLTGSKDIALDILLEADGQIYADAVDHLETYVGAVRASQATKTTVSSPRHFAKIITDVAQRGSADGLEEIIRLANAQCNVPRLESVPPMSWPPLCASVRTACTFGNIQSYLAEFGGIDDSLASLLHSYGAVEWRDVPQADRVGLATTVANSAASLPGIRLRVRLIRSLRCEITASDIAPASGTFVANLLRSHLVADDGDVFAPRLMVDWSTLEATIKASKHFESFVSPAVLPAQHVASMLKSTVRQELKRKVVTQLAAYLKDADGRTARNVAETLVSSRWRLPPVLIEAVQAAGARPADVVRLLGQAGDLVSVDEIRSILRGLPAPYSKIADPTGYRPSVPDDEQHRAVLDRLASARVVKSHKPDLFRQGYRKVSSFRR